MDKCSRIISFSTGFSEAAKPETHVFSVKFAGVVSLRISLRKKHTELFDNS